MSQVAKYSLREEKANWISHSVGIFFSIIAASIVIPQAAIAHNVWAIVAYSIMFFSMFLSYTTSTVYHAVRSPQIKQIFRKIDHAAIYLFIAGSYAPMTLMALREKAAWGWTLFGISWAAAIIGITINFVGRMKSNNILKTATYIVMGSIIFIAIQPLMVYLDEIGHPEVLYWILAEGFFYIFGAVIYSFSKHEFVHFVWHIFVLLGSAAHVVAMYIIL